jgi:hypothetical protein
MIIELGTLLIWRKRTVFAVESVWATIVLILMSWSIQDIGSNVIQDLMSHFVVILFHWH